MILKAIKEELTLVTINKPTIKPSSTALKPELNYFRKGSAASTCYIESPITQLTVRLKVLDMLALNEIKNRIQDAVFLLYIDVYFYALRLKDLISDDINLLRAYVLSAFLVPFFLPLRTAILFIFDLIIGELNFHTVAVVHRVHFTHTHHVIAHLILVLAHHVPYFGVAFGVFRMVFLVKNAIMMYQVLNERALRIRMDQEEDEGYTERFHPQNPGVEDHVLLDEGFVRAYRDDYHSTSMWVSKGTKFEGGWIKNLTTEGIEPNPGPVMSKEIDYFFCWCCASGLVVLPPLLILISYLCKAPPCTLGVFKTQMDESDDKTIYGKVEDDDATLCYEDKVAEIINNVAMDLENTKLNCKFEEIIEKLKEDIEALEFETQMQVMEVSCAKSRKERTILENELKRKLKILEKKMSEERKKNRDAKHVFKTQMFPSLKVDLSSDTKSLLDDLNETLSNGIKFGLDTDTTKIFTEIKEGVVSLSGKLDYGLFSSRILKNMHYILDFIVVLTIARYFSTDISATTKTMLLTMCTTYFGLKYGLPKATWKTQMLETEVQSISEFAVMALHAFLITNAPTTFSSASKLSDFFSNYGKITENAGKGIMSVLNVVESFVNWIRVNLLKVDPLVMVESKDEDLSDWMEKAEKVVNRFESGDRRVNIDRCMEISSIQRQGFELESKYGSYRNKSALFGKFTYLFTCVKGIVKFYSNLNFQNHSTKVQTIAACFMGGPGLGKTFPSQLIAYRLLALTLPESELPSFRKNPYLYIYSMNTDLGYRDGMTGAERIYVDSEWRQAKVVPGVFTPNADFISTVDTHPKIANMAEVTKKGMIREEPWFHLNCTNCFNPEFNMDDITDTGAVWRRFKRHIYFVGIPAEFATDATKDLEPWRRMVDEYKVGLQYRDIQIYYRVELENGVWRNRGEFTMKEVVKMMVEDFERSKEKRNLYLETANSFIDECLKERFGTQMFEGVDNRKEQIVDKMVSLGLPVDILLKRYVDWCAENDEDVLTSLEAWMSLEHDYPEPPGWKEYFTSCYDKFKTASQRLVTAAQEFEQKYGALKLGLAFIGGILAFKGLISTFSSSSNDVQHPPESEFDCEADSGDRGRGRRKQNRPQKVRFNRQHKHNQDFTTEGGFDQATADCMTAIYNRNLYSLTMPGMDRRSGFIVFVKNRVALMPLHFFHKIKRDIDSGNLLPTDCAKLGKCGTKLSLDIPLSYMLKAVPASYDKEDFCVFEAPNDFPLHKDITNLFIEEDLLSSEIDQKGVLLLPSRENLKEMHYSRYFIYSDIHHQSDANVFYYNMHSACYEIPTRVGDCGAVFALVNPSVKGGRILGIHVGGTDNGKGLSVVITKEEISKMTSKVDSVRVTELETTVLTQSDFPDYFAGTIHHGRHPSSVRNPTQSKIIASCLSGIFGPPKTKPARLAREFDKSELTFDPFMKGLLKHVRDRPVVEEDILDACVDHLYTTLMNNSPIPPILGKETLSFERAVLGDPLIPQFGAIPRNTSAGYPYAMPGGICSSKPGKTAFFGTGQDYDLTNANCVELKAKNEKILQNLRKGIRDEVIYMDFAKDERRPIAKVDEGKTRMINACPLDHLITVRRLFMAFELWIMQNRIHNGIAIGMNPYSHEWNLLATKLKSKGSSVDAGDFSEFDYSENAPFLWAILKLINRWYSNDDNISRETSWFDVVNSKHINGSYVYSLISSLPSGHPLTIIINSLYVLLSFRYGWVLLHRGDIASLSSFNDHLYIIAGGDDNVHNKSPYASMIMTEERLMCVFSMMGLKYTNEKKDGITKTMRTLADVSFFKRDFRWEPIVGRYICPLTLDTILEFVYWTKKGSQSEVITKQNVDNCLHELSLHSLEVFNKYAPTLLLESHRRLGYTPYPTNYHQLMIETLDREEFW